MLPIFPDQEGAHAPPAASLQFTFEFVRKALGARPGRIAEVGCGEGTLAEMLVRAGHCVVALDASNDAVTRAQARGVDARVARWPSFQAIPFTAIVFNRSLHHLQPVGAAVRRAFELTQPGGRLIAEDFAFAEADASTILWFRAELESLARTGAFAPAADTFALRILAACDPVRAWQEAGRHHITANTHIEAAIARWFTQARCTDVPYLFRYVEQSLAPGAHASVTFAFLQRETEAIAARRIRAIGRRHVARRPPSH